MPPIEDEDKDALVNGLARENKILSDKLRAIEELSLGDPEERLEPFHQKYSAAYAYVVQMMIHSQDTYVNMSGEISNLRESLEKAEANYIRVNEENALQEQEIADLTRELLQTRTKIAEMRERAIEEVPEPDSRVAWITLGFCAVAVALIVGILDLLRR